MTMYYIKTVLLLVTFLLTAFFSSAQFRAATMRIDGLTCSMCSNSVDKAIKKLDFVENVQMNLNSNIAEVVFREGIKVDIKRLAQAVKDAGYSVGYLNAAFYFDSLTISEGFSFLHDNDHYRFVSSDEKTLTGLVTLKFLGKIYQEKKEYLQSVTLYSAYMREDKKKNVYYIQL